MSDLPEPVWYTITEGGEWLPWDKQPHRTRVDERCVLVHSVMFDNGRVFDAVNGWRNALYCTNCWKEKYAN